MFFEEEDILKFIEGPIFELLSGNWGNFQATPAAAKVWMTLLGGEQMRDIIAAIVQVARLGEAFAPTPGRILAMIEKTRQTPDEETDATLALALVEARNAIRSCPSAGPNRLDRAWLKSKVGPRTYQALEAAGIEAWAFSDDSERPFVIARFEKAWAEIKTGKTNEIDYACLPSGVKPFVGVALKKVIG